MKRAERLHAIVEMLRRSGVRGSAEHMAIEFGVSTRTIKRDLDSLESSGAPLWSRLGPGGGYGLATVDTLPPVSFSAKQVAALLAAVAERLRTRRILTWHQRRSVRSLTSSTLAHANRLLRVPIESGSTHLQCHEEQPCRRLRRQWQTRRLCG